MKPVILWFEPDPKKLAPLRAAAVRAKLSLRRVPRAAYGMPVGQIAQSASELPSGEGGEPLPCEMMVFCGLPDAAVSSFLSLMRQNRCTVKLKAVLTEQNAGWDAEALCRELSEEHLKMTGETV